MARSQLQVNWPYARGNSMANAPTDAPIHLNTFNEREAELLRGMLQVQLGNVARSEKIANTPIAIQQATWDRERVALLRKIMQLGGVQENKVCYF